jgi:DNA-directed RNA polymerase subunit M/transcription elongation factor TFIIS
MSDSVRDLLVRGIAAAKSNEKEQARFYLEWALRLDPSTEQVVDANFWLSEISDDPEEKRNYLEEVLVNQPNHYQARRSLAILDGRLNPDDIVDPNQLPRNPIAAQGPVQAQRFVCPNCGGRLAYAPDGKSLVCEHCQATKELDRLDREEMGAESGQDFTIALATARGHTKPVTTRTFECRACGAVYIIAPQTLSLTCPYCASVYVVEHTETRNLIPPEGIIPFVLSKGRATKLAQRWLISQELTSGVRLDPFQGVYFPVWAFTLSGLIPYTYWEDDDDSSPKTGQKLLSYPNILIPASDKLPDEYIEEIDGFDLDQLVSYDNAYLANWPAETYQITLSDASLEARWKTLEMARPAIAREINSQFRNLNIDSSKLLIETFKLILVPLWVTRYRSQGSAHLLLVNGQTSSVWGATLARKVPSWLSRLVGDE